MSSVVWTLIDNGKLANQIERLVAVVVKCCINNQTNNALIKEELQRAG